MLDEPGLVNDAMADFFGRVEETISSGTSFVPKHSQNVPPPVDGGHPEWGALIVSIAVALLVGIVIGRMWSSQSRRGQCSQIDSEWQHWVALY